MSSTLVSRAVDAVKPTPWGELGAFGRVRRVVTALFGLSAIAMAWAANTADSDWNLTQKDVEKQFG